MQRTDLRLSDILNLYRTLERDSRELRDTLIKIPENRDYSQTIRNSISTELEKLDAIQNELLTLPISLESSGEPSQNAERIHNIPQASHTNPEIISTASADLKKEPVKNKSPRRY